MVLKVHWEGGVHTNLLVKKNRRGEHGKSTDKSTVELVRQLAQQLPDKAIAPVLNKLKLKTGAGNTWTAVRIRSLRSHNKIPVYTTNREDAIITLEQAAEKLGVCAQSVRKLISQKLITAQQVVPYAPWAIPVGELEKDEVQVAIGHIRMGVNRRNQHSRCSDQIPLFQ